VRLRRLAIGTSALGLVAGGLTLTAVPAHAAADFPYVTCGSAGSAGPSRSLTVGGSYTIQNVGSAACTSVTSNQASSYISWTSSDASDTPSANPTTLAAGATLTVSADAQGSETLTISGGGYTLTMAFTVNAPSPSPTPPPSPSTPTSTSQTPPSHLQQVALPASGECTDIDDSGLAWDTGLTGGWTKAWGEWIDNGLGGWACSRTLQYSTAQSAWVTAS